MGGRWRILVRLHRPHDVMNQGEDTPSPLPYSGGLAAHFASFPIMVNAHEALENAIQSAEYSLNRGQLDICLNGRAKEALF